jgi:hypothetical protein
MHSANFAISLRMSNPEFIASLLSGALVTTGAVALRGVGPLTLLRANSRRHKDRRMLNKFATVMGIE